MTSYQEIAKPPKLLRQFSKQRSPNERNEIADQMHAKRMEHFGPKRIAQEQKLRLEGQLTETEIDTDRQLQRIEHLDEQISKLSGSIFDRAWNYFKIRSLNPHLTAEQAALRQSQKQREEVNQQHHAISTPPATPAQLEQARKMFQDFYLKEEEKWIQSPYDKDIIQRSFTEQRLASLSLDDYILLLKRFPGEMVTHVTRQGIRDHSAHAYHTVAVGQYLDGFMQMLADGRLRSPLGVYLKDGLKEAAILEFILSPWWEKSRPKVKTREDAIRELDTLTVPPSDSDREDYFRYSDKTAVHVATEEVADGYYGSERGNEIFLVFPSVLIASQYFFQGQLTKPGDNAHNDQFIWANEGRGIDINAGLVFIPAEAQVDPATGSRYKLDAANHPVINQAYVDKIKELAKSADLEGLAREVDGIIDDSDSPAQMQPMYQVLEQRFGIRDKRLQTVLIYYRHLPEVEKHAQIEFDDRSRKILAMDQPLKDAPTPFDAKIRQMLISQSILYVEAENAISSHDFWESYFANHPNQRPSKVVYYKGSDPTAALQEWKKTHGITKAGIKSDLGFPEHYVTANSPQATAGLERFRSIAEAAINKYFDDNPETA